MSPSFHALHCWRTILTHVGVGMGAASFWRGAWYVLDDQLFPEQPHWSAVTCLGLGTAGMAASQGIVARAMAVQRPLLKPVARFGALYTIAMSCILVWRGTWVGWDCIYEHYHNEIMVKRRRQQQQQQTLEQSSTTTILSNNNNVMATSSSFLDHSPAHAVVKSTDPGHLTISGLASHSFAIVALGACGVFASVLAPPAAVSVIKDLAIQASYSSAGKRRMGTTTAYIKKNTNSNNRDVVNNKAYEFIPQLANYLKNTPIANSTTTSSSASSSALASSMNSTATSSSSSSRTIFTKVPKSTTVITNKRQQWQQRWQQWQ